MSEEDKRGTILRMARPIEAAMVAGGRDQKSAHTASIAEARRRFHAQHGGRPGRSGAPKGRRGRRRKKAA